jgi:hypothetical protein
MLFILYLPTAYASHRIISQVYSCYRLCRIDKNAAYIDTISFSGQRTLFEYFLFVDVISYFTVNPLVPERSLNCVFSGKSVSNI